MFIDYWYGHCKKDIAYIDCFFSDCDCVYRGNIYDKNKKPIGDYTTSDSVEIEETFSVKFN